MKLKHVYKNVYVKGKNAYHQFHDGFLEIEDEEEIEVLLQNPLIEKVQEAEGTSEETSEASPEAGIDETHSKKGKKK